MGVAHEPSEEGDPEPDAKDVEKRQKRKKFLSKLRGLVGKLTTAIEENADAACDQMGKRLMAEVDLLSFKYLKFIQMMTYLCPDYCEGIHKA